MGQASSVPEMTDKICGVLNTFLSEALLAVVNSGLAYTHHKDVLSTRPRDFKASHVLPCFVGLYTLYANTFLKGMQTLLGNETFSLPFHQDAIPLCTFDSLFGLSQLTTTSLLLITSMFQQIVVSVW